MAFESFESIFRDTLIEDLKHNNGLYTPFEVELEFYIIRDTVKDILEKMYDEGTITIDSFGFIQVV